VEVELLGQESRLRLRLDPPNYCKLQDFKYEELSGRFTFSEGNSAPALAEAFAARLASLGLTPVHPLGADRIEAGPTHERLGWALGRLRRAAPFGELSWEGLAIREEGRRAELSLSGAGQKILLFLELDEGGAPRGGYRLLGEAAGELDDRTKATLGEGLRAALGAIRRG
jgi:hypothetical protein